MSEDEGNNRPKFCPRCGHEAPAHGNFCPECGADIVAEAEPTAPTQDSQGTGGQTTPGQPGDGGGGDPSPPPTQTPPPAAPDTEESTVLTRRNALIGGGVLIAGGAGAWWLTQESGPEYGDDVTQEDLLLPVSRFPQGWRRDDNFNDNWDTTYLNSGETIVILADAEYYETVEGAKSLMQSGRESVQNPNDMSVGDDAFWAIRSDDVALCYVRDSNVAAGLGAVRQSGFETVPDQTRAQRYGREFYDYWQTL